MTTPTQERDLAFIQRWSREFPWLKELEHTPQDQQWHGEGNVRTHTLMVLTELDAFDPNFVTRFAALLHDVGKVKVTRAVFIGGQSRIISPAHAYEGFSHVAHRILDATDLSIDDARDVLGLIRYHHHPKRLVNMDVPHRGLACRLERAAGNEQLWKLERADVHGRICEDREWQVEQIDLYRTYCRDWGFYARAADPYESFRDDAYDAVSRAEVGPNADILAQELTARCIQDYEAGVVFSMEEALSRNYWALEDHATVHILTGPPASGKSTFARETLLTQPDTAYVSMDAIREKIRANQRKWNQGHVLQAALEEYRSHLRAARNVVWDSTNLTKDIRKRLIGLARDYGAFVNLYGFSLSPENLLKRNRARGETVPSAAVLDMSDRYQFPDYDEGDVTWIVNRDGEHFPLLPDRL